MLFPWRLQNSYNALWGASLNGHTEIVKHLVEQNADISKADKYTVSTAMRDGLFDCLSVQTFCVTAMVFAVCVRECRN